MPEDKPKQYYSYTILLYCTILLLFLCQANKIESIQRFSTRFQTIGQTSKLWLVSSQSCDLKHHPSHPSSGHRPPARTTNEWNHFNFLPTRTVMALGAVTEDVCAVSYCTLCPLRASQRPSARRKCETERQQWTRIEPPPMKGGQCERRNKGSIS